jgi:hypothetical protein
MDAIGTDFGGYSIKGNNCEHFARWCVTGVRSAQQSVFYNYFPFSQTLLLRTVAAGSYMGRILMKSFFDE